LRSALVIDADAASVESALWSASVWSRAWAARGRTVSASVSPEGGSADRLTSPDGSVEPSAAPSDDRLVPGELLTLERSGHRRVASFRIFGPPPAPSGSRSGNPTDPEAPAALGKVIGPTLVGITGAARGWTIRSGAAATGVGLLTTIDVQRAGGLRGAMARRRVLGLERVVLGVVSLVARDRPTPTTIRTPAAVPTAPTEPQVVVAGVIIQGGRVLAGRRRYPPDLAGRWECPGGKVEAGESEAAALIRELREELAVETAVGDLLGEFPLAAGLVLRAYRVSIITGTPQAQEHDQLSWFTAREVRTVDWLPGDAPLMEIVVRLLAEDTPGDGQADDAVEGASASGTTPHG
jgi:8-oxo-dGTP diphosphatase